MNKNFKIKIEGVEHSKQVQAAMFELGYAWNHSDKRSFKVTDAEFLFGTGSDKCITYTNDTSYFARASWTEVFLVDGKLTDKPAAKPPLGLRPRYIAEALRAQEILAACTRYASEAKPIPAVWLEELTELNSRVK